MRLTRRSVLGVGGLAAVAGLAGCSGVLGGASGGPRDWQFDVGAVSETPNRLFGTLDHARLSAHREHLPPSVRETVDTVPYSPLDTDAVESMAGVGGIQFGDHSTGSSVAFRSVVTLGSFDRGALEQRVRTAGDPDAERDYAGLTLFEGVDGENAGGVDGIPGDDTPFTMAAVAVGDEALIVGWVSVRGRNAGMVLAPAVVEATVDAGTGDGPRLQDTDDRVSRLADITGEATVSAGLRADPALLDRYRQADGPVGTLATGLRAAGIGLAVEGEMADLTLAGLYEDAASADAGDALELVEGVAAEAAGIEAIDATDDGEAVVVTVTGETQALLEGPAPAPPTG